MFGHALSNPSRSRLDSVQNSFLVGDDLFSTFHPLSYKGDVKSLLLLYRYFQCKCSDELSIPLVSPAQTSRYQNWSPCPIGARVHEMQDLFACIVFWKTQILESGKLLTSVAVCYVAQQTFCWVILSSVLNSSKAFTNLEAGWISHRSWTLVRTGKQLNVKRENTWLLVKEAPQIAYGRRQNQISTDI